MWFPETTFDWVIVGYVLAGLIYVAYVYNEISSEEGRENAQKYSGPMSPDIFRIAYPVVCVVVIVVVLTVWPIVLGFEVSYWVLWWMRRK